MAPQYNSVHSIFQCTCEEPPLFSGCTLWYTIIMVLGSRKVFIGCCLSVFVCQTADHGTINVTFRYGKHQGGLTKIH